MRTFAAVLFLASAACALPQYYYRPGYASYGFGGRYPYQPQSLQTFRYGQNPIRNQQYQPQYQPLRNQQFQPSRNQQFQPSRSVAAPQNTVNTGFGGLPLQGITADQRATYLPVMRALLKVMNTDRPAPSDINTLMVATRELNKKVPKGQNLLGNFGDFGIGDLESMGLPETGDIVVDIDGIPHIRTQWGTFPLSDTNLMSDSERSKFLPAVTAFTNVLEKGSASPNESAQLLQYAKDVSELIPGGLGAGLGGLAGGSLGGSY